MPNNLVLFFPWWNHIDWDVQAAGWHFCSLADRILVESDIGLKSSTDSGLSFFGIKAIMDELMLLRSIFWEEKSWKSLVKSSLTMFQHFLMSRPLRPSGPGAWLLGRFLITISISSWVNSSSKCSRLCEGRINHRICLRTHWLQVCLCMRPTTGWPFDHDQRQ